MSMDAPLDDNLDIALRIYSSSKASLSKSDPSSDPCGLTDANLSMEWFTFEFRESWIWRPAPDAQHPKHSWIPPIIVLTEDAYIDLAYLGCLGKGIAFYAPLSRDFLLDFLATEGSGLASLGQILPAARYIEPLERPTPDHPLHLDIALQCGSELRARLSVQYQSWYEIDPSRADALLSRQIKEFGNLTDQQRQDISSRVLEVHLPQDDVSFKELIVEEDECYWACSFNYSYHLPAKLFPSPSAGPFAPLWNMKRFAYRPTHASRLQRIRILGDHPEHQLTIWRPVIPASLYALQTTKIEPGGWLTMNFSVGEGSDAILGPDDDIVFLWDDYCLQHHLFRTRG